MHRSKSETKQSYLLLAFGILIAIALPFLLRPRATAPSAAPATAMSGHSPPGSSR